MNALRYLWEFHRGSIGEYRGRSGADTLSATSLSKREMRHNASLDGLRGVAALAVCISHMSLAISPGKPTPFHGNLAVDFFFILSGFVIDRAYTDKLRTSMSVARFTALRIIRLFPLILLGMALGIVVFGPQFSPGQLAAIVATGLLMLPISIAGNGFFPLDNPLWSLLYEFWANLLYAFLARFRWTANAFAALGALILIFITLRGHHISGGFGYNTLIAGVGRILWGFFIGIVLSRYLTAGRVQSLPTVPFPLLAGGLWLILINLRTGPWYDDLCVFALFPGLVALAVKDAADGLTRRIALLAGALSYPLYVLHQPLASELANFKAHALEASAVLLALILAVSYGALKYYDEPVRDWFGRKMRRPISLPITTD